MEGSRQRRIIEAFGAHFGHNPLWIGLMVDLVDDMAALPRRVRVKIPGNGSQVRL